MTTAEGQAPATSIEPKPLTAELQSLKVVVDSLLDELRRGSGDRDKRRQVEEWLKDNGIRMESLHTSGHAAPITLQRLATTLAPRRLVPIHTFERDKYPDLFDNVTIHEDGTWWEV